MSNRSVEVVVAGHICLDILPAFTEYTSGAQMLMPGKLIEVGPALLAVGGAVSNTGLALHRLGFATRLLGKVGNDQFGHLILDIIRGHGQELAQEMLVADGVHSSYTIVLSPPGIDRIFLHHAGANDVFHPDEIKPEHLHGARLFHFGYPPIMRCLYHDGGQAFAALLAAIKADGLTVTLDMALPDPASEAGHVDWTAWLARVLPYVDIFLPSVEEIGFMLGYPEVEQERSRHLLDGQRLQEIAERLLAWGAAIVVLKLGSAGLYMRTTGDPQRLARLGRCAPAITERWRSRELVTACFQVNVVGTTGAGDCTIAGYLAGLLRGLSPEEVLTRAVAVGACSVEQADATSGVPAWSTVEQRIRSGWQRSPSAMTLADWLYDEHDGVWKSPRDRR